MTFLNFTSTHNVKSNDAATGTGTSLTTGIAAVKAAWGRGAQPEASAESDRIRPHRRAACGRGTGTATVAGSAGWQAPSRPRAGLEAECHLVLAVPRRPAAPAVQVPLAVPARSRRQRRART